jgi:hypothetical protein
MKTRSEIGLDILKFALVLGLLGDVLLRAKPWGLNVFLFNLAFVVGFAVLLWRSAPQRLTASSIALMGAQLFFAARFVWRDSIELRVADTFAILAIMSVQLLPQMQVTQRLAGAFHFMIGFLWSGFSAFFAPAALLLNDVEWSSGASTGWRKHTAAIIRGVAIATPLVLVFGGLFIAADAAYEGLVQRAFNIDLSVAFSHAVLIGIFGWLSMGYLRGAVISPLGATDGDIPTDAPSLRVTPETRFSDVAADTGELPATLPGDRPVVDHLNVSDPPNASAETGAPIRDNATTEKKPDWQWSEISNSLLPQVFTLGTTEVAVILIAMNLLFLSFVIVQVPYLFGGMELVQTTPDFKLADYARRGFGELVTVSGLVLPMLLIGQWLIRKEALRAQVLFKILAGTQIALLFVIMASAVQRLLILTGSLGYGMTTIRFYPMIFMTWLAVVFVWFGVTVLRGARQYFAWGALWSAFFVLGATHVLDPDAFIVRTNLELMRQGRQFDAAYNAGLSDDALPALLGSFDQLSATDQRSAIPRIARRYCEMQGEHDIRSWNVSRETARTMLDSNGEFVTALGPCEGSRFVPTAPFD